MKKSFVTVFLSLFILNTANASEDSFSQKIKVNYSKPVYETIEEVIPPTYGRECYKEEEVRVPRYSSSNNSFDNEIGLDTIIGATSGVIIGNQIGKGNGKVAAKVIGGILGATVANSIRNNNDTYNGDYYYETRKRLVCSKPDKIVRKKVLVGYDNYFTFNDRKYSKFSEQKRKFVRVNTTINF